MLGLKYVVAKSRELSTRLEAPGGAAAAAGDARDAADDAADVASGAGGAFLRQRRAQMDQVLARHHSLVDRWGTLGDAGGRSGRRSSAHGQESDGGGCGDGSGEQLGVELGKTRQKLLDQAESAQFVAQNFHLVARVRQQLSHLRCVKMTLAAVT